MGRPFPIPPDRFVVLDGVRLHYLDWGGDGETVLLLAGLGCSANVFVELAPRLGDRFRVLALSRRGHGPTDPVRGGYALEDGAEDARRLLDALEIERAHVAGHSMGGGEVSLLAARHPGRVDRVVHLEGAYDWADHPSAEWAEEAEGPERFPSYEDYADHVRALFPEAVRGPAFDANLRASVDVQAHGSVVDRFSAAGVAPFVRALKAFRHPWSEISAPALAVYAVGEHEPGDQAAWRVACRDRFAAETVHARVVELRASHYVFLDRRDDVLSAMREHLTTGSG